MHKNGPVGNEKPPDIVFYLSRGFLLQQGHLRPSDEYMTGSANPERKIFLMRKEKQSITSKSTKNSERTIPVVALAGTRDMAPKHPLKGEAIFTGILTSRHIPVKRHFIPLDILRDNYPPFSGVLWTFCWRGFLYL